MASIPLAYEIWFLWLEPGMTVLGWLFVWVLPVRFLTDIHAATAPGIFGLPTATHVATNQLANLCLAYALPEAFVLRATSDRKVWRVLLACLLVVDLGHIVSCYPLGADMYYDFTKWNLLAWGNYASVYYGASNKICFLLGIGLGGVAKAKESTISSVKAATNDLNGIVTNRESKTPNDRVKQN